MTDFNRLQKECQELFELWRELGVQTHNLSTVFQNGFHNISQEDFYQFVEAFHAFQSGVEFSKLKTQKFLESLPDEETRRIYLDAYEDVQIFYAPQWPDHEVYMAGWNAAKEQETI